MIDYHVHSDISADCKVKMADMAGAAALCGIRELCFTEHIDLGLTEGPEFMVDFKRYRATLDEVKAAYPKINIRMGIEAGLDINTKDQMGPLLSGLDYVIGSQHLVYGNDPYYEKAWQGHSQREIYEEYLAESLRCAAACDFYDVLGHLGYIAKFCPYEDRLMRYGDFTDAVDAVLKRLVEKGKGLEVNTNGLYMTPDTMPETPIIRRFFELGGEIITVGSDAHYETVVGHAIPETLETLKEIGFKYVCAFNARVPEFILIP
jgi:histidinol phosphate phosphatase HisJ family